MIVNYSITYPAVDRQDPRNSDPLRTFNAVIDVREKRSETLERIFAGWNAGSGNECLAFRQARARSLSVGDIVHFEDSSVYHICDSHGWMTVNADQAAAWLLYRREYGCCSFELHKWADEAGVVHCMTEYKETMKAECWP